MKTLREIITPENNTKLLRLHLGLTQVEFAELLGTTQITISAWENGKCPAYINKLAELAINERGVPKLSEKE